MKCHALLVRTSVLLSLAFLVVETPRFAAQSNPQAASPSSIVQTPAVAARITEAIDETQLVRLKGNVHPLARAEFDQGAVEDSQPMNRMLLLLQRSQEQQSALDQLMLDLHNSSSPNYHKWPTPDEFGRRFGSA